VNFSAAPQAGELLVCSEADGRGFFDQAVILLLDSDENGAIGVALNRPSNTPVEQVLPDWGAELTPPAVLFAGGPMTPNGAICLAQVMESGEEPPGWRPIRGDLGLLHLDTPVEIAAGAYSDVRVFAGYAGWDPGQLNDELDRGLWIRAQLQDEDVFGVQSSGLWRRVLRRAGGDSGLLSGYAEQPARN